MSGYPAPSICIPCIERNQERCKHRHTTTRGGYHFHAGEVWDDITEVCDDCGVVLDDLPFNTSTQKEDETIQF
jgi:hypothetical protein